MAKWKWSLGNEDFDNNKDFDYWALNEPFDTRTGDSCAVMTPRGFWYDTSCAKLRSAVCYYGKKDFYCFHFLLSLQSVKFYSKSQCTAWPSLFCFCFLPAESSPTYIYVNTAMTWYQARGLCRTNYTDLASVTTINENDEVSFVVLADAWIGLHRTPWAWSDSSTSNFTNWYNFGSSSITSVRSCATASTITGLWWEANCDEEHYFICEDVFYSNSNTSINNPSTVQPKGQTATKAYKLKFKSNEDMNNPGVQEQILSQVQYVWS